MDLYVDKLEALTQRVAEACEDEKEDVKTILNSGTTNQQTLRLLMPQTDGKTTLNGSKHYLLAMVRWD